MANRYIKTSVVCAGPQCSQVKGTANHWFVILRGSDLPEPHPCNVLKPLYRVYAYDVRLVVQDEYALPVCGEQCLQKLQSELLRK